MDGRIKSIKSGKLAGGQARVHRGGYRAQPSHCRYVPKPDGGQRPLGIAAPEDKIVQRATVELLNAIYEEDFLGFSHGFRAGRSQHDAPRVKPVGRRLTDALTVAIERTAVKWILDADMASFIDTVDHEHLIRFVEHRIGDRGPAAHGLDPWGIVRLIRKWLTVGVMEDGEIRPGMKAA